jgi:hypothetical protein
LTVAEDVVGGDGAALGRDAAVVDGADVVGDAAVAGGRECAEPVGATLGVAVAVSSPDEHAPTVSSRPAAASVVAVWMT